MKRMSVFSHISIIASALLLAFCGSETASGDKTTQIELEAKSKTIITVDGLQFKDLNDNGELDPYEDWRLSADQRADDLINNHMTAAEKIGLMLHTNLADPKSDGSLNDDGGSVSESLLTFNARFGVTRNSLSTTTLRAIYANNLQTMAEGSRLGIPFVISVDPIHYVDYGYVSGFSQFPSPLGMGATDDVALVRESGIVMSAEYRAVGIRMALSPMADLATEPRWSRITGTFSADADKAAAMTAAYINGFQGNSITKDSVACMVKHFPGAGPQEDGYDGHFEYGKNQVYPGDNMAYHLKSFEAAFAAGAPCTMPYYSIPVGQTTEVVGMGFNSEIITDLLRTDMGFEGFVCTDWMIVEDTVPFGMPWGVESLTKVERVVKAVDAGVDQFGGLDDPQAILDAFGNGDISEDRINTSAKRILTVMFKLGLFEDPYVDPGAVRQKVNIYENKIVGLDAMFKSVVILKNENDVLPAPRGEAYVPSTYIDVFADGISLIEVGNYSNVTNPSSWGNTETPPTEAEITTAIQAADLAIIKVQAPGIVYDRTSFFAYLEDNLDYVNDNTDGTNNYDELEKIQRVIDAVDADTDGTKAQIIVVMEMSRPGIVRQFADSVDGIVATFGATDKALLDVLYDIVKPSGKLPVEIPRDWASVESQFEDVPFDCANPEYSFGHGLTW